MSKCNSPSPRWADLGICHYAPAAASFLLCMYLVCQGYGSCEMDSASQPSGAGAPRGPVSLAPFLQLMGIRLDFQMLTPPYFHCPPSHCPLMSEGEGLVGTPLGSCGDFCIDPASQFFTPLSPSPQCWYFRPLPPLSSSLGSLESPLETKGMRRDFPFFLDLPLYPCLYSGATDLMLIC